MLQLHDSTLLNATSLINGRSAGDPTIDVKNPSTGSLVGRVANLGAEAAIQAVEAASEALQSWRALVAHQRSAILRRWYDLVIGAKADLATILTSEQGKPYAEAVAEIEYAASFIAFFAEEANRIYGEILPSHRADARIMVLRQPIGVVAAITPWNFPAAMVTRKVAPALAAGCTVVLKPALETPLTALALLELAQRAGCPAGVVNLVTGEDAHAIGEVLTTHPEVRLVSFTGSTEVGKILMRQSASTVKKVALELGGNAPFIVFDDADLEAAVEGAILSKYRNMGQTCVCTNRVYVQSGIHDEFVQRFASRVSALKVGDGFSKGVEQGPLINEDAVSKIESHIADALSQGGKVVVGGQRHEKGGTFFEPTVLVEARASMAFAREETFGPLAPIFRFETEDEVIAAANNVDTGLAAYVFSRDLRRVYSVMERLEYGMVGVNTGAISTALAPFGGIKESGNSREGSHHGILEYTDLKYVCMGGL